MDHSPLGGVFLFPYFLFIKPKKSIFFDNYAFVFLVVAAKSMRRRIEGSRLFQYELFKVIEGYILDERQTLSLYVLLLQI